jgi:ubiquinone/menaquinone biosynthesis C-methylase UbiE
LDRLLEATARAEQEHFWWRGFRAFVRPAIARAAAGRRVRVLDCGCGTGANLAMLREFGPAVGIDLTWAGLAFARDRGERRVARATAGALPFPDAAFDLVTSFDMLQCVPDEAEPVALAEIRRVLGPGGHAVLNVAAMDILWGNHSILAHEVRRYSRRGLRERLVAAGLQPLRITYTNATLFPILAPLRIAQRAMGLATSDADAKAEQEVTIPVRPVNAAMTALLRLEAAAVRAIDMPFGSSLLAVAKNPG